MVFFPFVKWVHTIMSIGVFLLLSDCMPIGFFSLDVVSATVQCRYHWRLMRSVGNAIMSLCYVCVNVAIIGESPSKASRHRRRVSNKYEGFAIPLVFPPVLLPSYPTLPYPTRLTSKRECSIASRLVFIAIFDDCSLQLLSSPP